MELRWEANIAINGQWWATVVVSKDYVGEEIAKIKCRVLEMALAERFGASSVRVTLTKWEGVGQRYDIHC